jgi:hypothetical protein
VDWSRHLICGATLPFCHLGPPPLKEHTTLLWTPEDRVHCEVDGVSTCWQGPLWKFSSSSAALEGNELLGTWPLDAGRSGCGCNTLARLKNPPRLQCCCRSGALLHNYRCPKAVRMSGLGTETRLSFAYSSHTAYWVERIFRPAYYYAFERGDDVEESPYAYFSSIKLYVF